MRETVSRQFINEKITVFGILTKIDLRRKTVSVLIGVFGILVYVSCDIQFTSHIIVRSRRFVGTFSGRIFIGRYVIGLQDS